MITGMRRLPAQRRRAVTPLLQSASGAFTGAAIWNASGTVTTALQMTVVMPDDYAGGEVVCNINLRHVSGGGGLRLFTQAHRNRRGGTFSDLHPTLDQSRVAGPLANGGIVVSDKVAASLILPGDTVRFSIFRDGGHAFDTNTGDLIFEGCSVIYAGRS